MSDDIEPTGFADDEEQDEALVAAWEEPANTEDELVDYLLEEVTEVEDLLLEIKDVSELSVDLAYSSLLYDSEDIAEEVDELEETLETLQHRLQRKTFEGVAAGKIPIDKGLALIRIANAAEVISDAAAEIVDVVLRDMELHPVLASMIRESDATITRARVDAASFLTGQQLGEARLESETGMRVIAIKRGSTWIYGPDRDATLTVDDVLVMRGPPEGVSIVREALDGTRQGWN